MPSRLPVVERVRRSQRVRRLLRLRLRLEVRRLLLRRLQRVHRRRSQLLRDRKSCLCQAPCFPTHDDETVMSGPPGDCSGSESC